MKKSTLLLMPLLFASGLCSASQSNLLDQFKLVNSRFYSFGQESFQSVSCKIESPMLDNEIAGLNKALTGKAAFKTTLDKYRVTYEKPSTITFNDPTLSIKVIAAKIPDPAKLKLGMKQMKLGFKGQVQGIDTQVRAILASYEPIEYDKLYIKSVSFSSAGAYTFHYRYKGADNTDVISGHTVTSHRSQSGTSLTSVERFQPAPSGKLLLQHVRVNERNAIINENFSMAMQYQDLKAIIFPKTINVTARTGFQSAHQQDRMAYAINFTDCKIR